MKIDIGGGKNSKKGFKVLDIIPEADFICDIEKENFPFEKEGVAEYYSQHTFEHIYNIIHVFNEVWRTLKWNGKITIKVPHKDCILAWQDPTHKRFWTEESFKFFCGEYLKKYNLDYGIKCCFKPISIDVAPGKTSNSKKEKYFTEITAVLEKNKEYYKKINYPKIKKEEKEYTDLQKLRQEQFNKIQKELLELFSKKNSDYGDGYFSGDYTDIERWMSIKRKVARLENFYKQGKLNGNDESLDDTWKDLAIYCIMELMFRRNKNE